jgi:serine/threonine-protein kinase PknK
MLDRAVAVKVLITDLDPDNLDRFMREQRAMGRLSGERRPLAALQTQLLLVATLTAAGRATDAQNELAPVTAKCADVGLSRLLVDAGLA